MAISVNPVIISVSLYFMGAGFPDKPVSGVNIRAASIGLYSQTPSFSITRMSSITYMEVRKMNMS